MAAARTSWWWTMYSAEFIEKGAQVCDVSGNHNARAVLAQEIDIRLPEALRWHKEDNWDEPATLQDADTREAVASLAAVFARSVIPQHQVAEYDKSEAARARMRVPPEAKTTDFIPADRTERRGPFVCVYAPKIPSLVAWNARNTGKYEAPVVSNYDLSRVIAEVAWAGKKMLSIDSLTMTRPVLRAFLEANWRQPEVKAAAARVIDPAPIYRALSERGVDREKDGLLVAIYNTQPECIPPCIQNMLNPDKPRVHPVRVALQGLQFPSHLSIFREEDVLGLARVAVSIERSEETRADLEKIVNAMPTAVARKPEVRCTTCATMAKTGACAFSDIEDSPAAACMRYMGTAVTSVMGEAARNASFVKLPEFMRYPASLSNPMCKATHFSALLFSGISMGTPKTVSDAK